MTVGQRMKKRRKELGLTADEVAEKLGKNRTTIYRYENDEIENIPILSPLAKILNTTPTYLMGWSEKPEITLTDRAAKLAATIIKNEDSVEVLEGYFALNEENKKIIYSMIKALSDK